MHYFISFYCGAALLFLGACSASKSNIAPYVPTSIDHGCAILNTDDSWREAFSKTYQKYGVPPHVVMAVIHQESRFVHDARAPTSNAYGYAQALTETWEWYKGKTGKTHVYRDYLPHAVDFIGWYLRENNRRTNVSKWDASTQYLAYHDGTGGYLRGSHLKKPWLLAVADKVGERAAMYRNQLGECFQYPAS